MPSKTTQRYIPSEEDRMVCIHCEMGHIYVCNCGHPHSHHTRMGGCRREGCKCERYDQTHQRLSRETQEAFDKRIISNRVKGKEI